MIDITVKIEKETPRAYLVSDGAVKEWIPKSQIECTQTLINEGDTVTIEIPEWLAEEKGFI